MTREQGDYGDRRQTASVPIDRVGFVAACARLSAALGAALARTAWRWIPDVSSILSRGRVAFVAAAVLSARVREGLIGSLVRYLAQPVEDGGQAASVNLRCLASALECGDVLLTDGKTRMSALVKRVMRSPWSHVALYVGPLEDGPDPRCIVEADIAEGVRAIRLSQLDARCIRVLRPVSVQANDRCRIAAWAIGRIGCEYDLAHALRLGRKYLLRPLQIGPRSMPATLACGTRRFICCSLLAQAFALAGYPILSESTRSRPNHVVDQLNLTPGDFDGARLFMVVEPVRTHSLASTTLVAETKVSAATIVG